MGIAMKMQERWKVWSMSCCISQRHDHPRMPSSPHPAGDNVACSGGALHCARGRTDTGVKKAQ